MTKQEIKIISEALERARENVVKSFDRFIDNVKNNDLSAY